MEATIKGIGKTIFQMGEVIKMGYPRRMVQEDVKSEDFSAFGFQNGKTYYINLPKYERYIECRQDDLEAGRARRNRK